MLCQSVHEMMLEGSKTRTMKLNVGIAVLFTTLVVVSPSQGQKPVKEDDEFLPSVVTKKDLYPADADAKKEIDEALKQAAGNHKRVLLVFGGNWCYDCHVLDRALHEGTAGQLMKEGFVLVHVDIGEGNKNLDLLKQYKIPLEKGVPAVAVLAGDGNLLYSSGDGEFEAARTMMKKDLVAFLRRWKDNHPSTSGKQ
jgi:VCBS repeat-containing protein